MKITEIQIIPIKPKDGLVAFASLIFDNCLYLGSIGVHRKLNNEGFRITFPNKKVGNSNIDIFHPINREAGKAIQEAILSKAEQILK